MRGLSPSFMAALQDGFLADLRHRVIADHDLDLHIRENYLNVYYKGNSLLKLTELPSGCYHVDIHEKFRGDCQLRDLNDHQTIQHLIAYVPLLKDRIAIYGKTSLEVEYEQLIIRANNLEPRNNTEYFVIDRQYAVETERFDLIGLYWNRQQRRRNQEVPLCLMEVKFALNSDIKEVHTQLTRYYEVVQRQAAKIAEEHERIFRQRLELGLYKQTAERLAAMKTLRITRDVTHFQFILILVDYNPHSLLLDREQLAQLAFAPQIRVFKSGFAMWNANLGAATEVLEPLE